MDSESATKDFVPTDDQLKEFEAFIRARELVKPPLHLSDLTALNSQAAVSADLENDEGNEEFGGYEDAPAEFEGAEHEAISNNLKLYEFNGTQNPAPTKTLWTVNTNNGTSVNLTYGRIIALGGDHYSNKDDDRSPICGAFYNYSKTFEGIKQRFDSAVKSLIQDSDGYLAAVNGLLDQENAGVEKGEKLGKSIKNLYYKKEHGEEHECGLPTDYDFWKAEASVRATTLSLYSWLAWINADHFGDDAVTCYKAGHALAMDKARAAASKSTASEKQSGLYEAYVYDAFAAHFLTDLFSAGHIRSPRRGLHCKNSTLMSATALQGKIIPGRTNETPVWDHHSRYMHDNDNATGLLVKNKRGDQWIVYGDKQLKEPANRTNLARAGHCVQVSVDEIYQVGFKGTSPIDTENFAALSLIPEPMVSIQGKEWLSSWGGYDMHNPAPLWVAKTDDDAETQGWTYRKSINDHSNFSRTDGSPAAGGIAIFPTASKEAWEIQGASFRGEDQYTESMDIGMLNTGGFLQIQDLERGKGCINIWGPSTVETDSKQNTFSLRRRLIDVVKQNESETGKTMYWAKWFDDDAQTTSLFHFNWASNGSNGEIVASGYSLKNLGSQLQNFDPTAEVSREFLPAAENSFYQKSLLSGLPNDYGRANLTRFLMGKFTPDSGPADPDIAIVTFANDGQARVSIRPVRNGELQESGQDLEWQAKVGARTWVKRLPRQEEKDSIAIISMLSKSGQKFNFRVSRIWSDDGSVLKRTDFDIGFYWRGLPEDVSVLVGNAPGSGESQIILIGNDGNEDTTLETYTFSGGMASLVSESRHICQDTDGNHIERQYFNSLIPSPKSNTRFEFDVLNVQLQKKKNGDHYLVFNVHGRNKSSTDAKPWTFCQRSELKDAFASNQNYFHIKWIRCEWQYTTNAVMQIFSYYGVLGVRVFAPAQNTNTDWQCVGVLPYLGQNSIGTGLGTNSDWGNGFMSWGENLDFVDVDECVSRGSYRAWAMSEKDTAVPNIRGFEVEKRAPYV